MKIISRTKDLENEVFQIKKKDLKIGFVSTMGNVHEGHFSLIEAAKKNCDKVIISLFRNPTQFESQAEFEKYPSNIEIDREKIQEMGGDIIFTPSQEEIYTEGKFLWKDDIHLPDIFFEGEGTRNPGYFQGIYQVLHRLFSVVQPDSVFFGQKNFQQTLLVYVLIHQEFGGEIELFRCPTIRESSGLAFSSKNHQLTNSEKEKASVLSRSLTLAKIEFTRGEKNTENLAEIIKKELSKEALVEKIHSIEFRSIHSFQQVTRADEKTIILLSCEFAGVHLIDNELLQ